MSTFNFKEISEQLNEAGSKNAGTGVSFAGRSLKLDTEKDGKLGHFVFRDNVNLDRVKEFG